MLTMLSRRNFSLLWLAWMISLAGDWVLLAALPFYVYIRTGSALATDVMFMAETLPALLIGPVAGVFVDRWDRRATLVIGSMVQGGYVLLLLLVGAGGWLWLVYCRPLSRRRLPSSPPRPLPDSHAWRPRAYATASRP